MTRGRSVRSETCWTGLTGRASSASERRKVLGSYSPRTGCRGWMRRGGTSGIARRLPSGSTRGRPERAESDQVGPLRRLVVCGEALIVGIGGTVAELTAATGQRLRPRPPRCDSSRRRT